MVKKYNNEQVQCNTMLSRQHCKMDFPTCFAHVSDGGDAVQFWSAGLLPGKQGHVCVMVNWFGVACRICCTVLHLFGYMATCCMHVRLWCRGDASCLCLLRWIQALPRFSDGGLRQGDHMWKAATGGIKGPAKKYIKIYQVISERKLYFQTENKRCIEKSQLTKTSSAVDLVPSDWKRCLYPQVFCHRSKIQYEKGN